MFVAVIYVCLATVAGASCDERTALAVLHAPPTHGLFDCLRQGEAEAASVALVRSGDYVKVRCLAPRERAVRDLGG